MNPIQGQTILLVDDDSELTQMVAQYLQREGLNVHAVENLADAKQAMTALRPDLIVLDLMLPDGNGLDFCKQLRTRNVVIAVLILTARGDPVDRVLGLEFGADDYLAKPFEPRELVARVRALLRRAGLGVANEMGQLWVGCLQLDFARRRVLIDDIDVPLTTIEFKLLLVLAKRASQAVSRDELADAA
jgi:DNA-binding response OmpR family regulator